MSNYSSRAQPFMDAFATSLFLRSETRNWLFKGTQLETAFLGSRSLHEEQRNRRAKTKQPFYCNYWCGRDKKCSCRVAGAKGLETDMMAFFENSGGRRAGVSFEFKSPGDKLSPGQAACYPLRAECWKAGRTNYSAIIPHDDTLTVLVAPDEDLAHPDTVHFQKKIGFSEASKQITDWPNGV